MLATFVNDLPDADGILSVERFSETYGLCRTWLQEGEDFPIRKKGNGRILSCTLSILQIPWSYHDISNAEDNL